MRVILVKKTLLVSAVATAMAVSGTAYAAASDGLYGKIRLGVQNAAELDVVSGKLVFGFKGDSDLGNGMTASYGIELEGDSADQETTNFSNDKSWVALSGGFGKVIIGEHSDMAGWACGGTDIVTYGTDEACSLVHNTSPANAVQYRGGSGAVEFGVAYVANGTGENPTLLGVKFDGGAFSVGAQFVSAGDLVPFSGVPAGESGSLIGATYQLGDITLGLTIADNGAAANEDATSFGFQMPLGSGNLVILVSSGDGVDAVFAGDSTDINYNASLGGGAYWGVEFTDDDFAADSVATAYLGMNF